MTRYLADQQLTSAEARACNWDLMVRAARLLKELEGA